AGKTFTSRTNSGFARTEIAVSESDPATAYISMVNQSDSKVGKMQVTGNAGLSWTDIVIPGGTETYTAGQGWYNNILAVHPLYAKIVYAGGLDIYKSTNSGSAWTKKSYWYNDQSSPQFVHADNHAIVFDPSDPKVMYAGNDGGVFKSTNLGDSWVSLNNGLCITQFYYGAVDPGANSTKYYGGVQDNGTIKTDNSPNGWYTIGGGDGGATEVDYVTPNVVYHEYINLQISKSTTGGGNAAICMNGIPTASGKTGTTDRTEFISPFILDPNNHMTLLAGTFKIYKTTNQAAQWTAISGDLSTDGRSNVSAIGVAHGNSDVIYAGYSNGVIQATTDNGTTWQKGIGLPNAYCKRIITDHSDTATAYAVYSGYSTYSKVFRSTNYGLSWVNITGDLPNIPVNCIQVNPADSRNIVIGTDLGIFVTENGGTNWVKNNNGLANVRVEDLDYRISDNRLFASTHGRGMYMASFNTVGVEGGKNTGRSDFHLAQNYPNPFNPSTNIRYTLNRESRVKIAVYNSAGQEIKELANSNQDAGTYTVRWDGRNNYGSDAASGVYYYKITSGNYTESKKMVLIR
ncbi:MAG: FlgD immunoglobulin-like domain containing protein, partial [Syntrophothermus sp.]